MTKVVLDDHLLRDLLAGDPGRELARLLRQHEPATTNLYLYRLCKSTVSARGGKLTGSWPVEQRRALGRRLVDLPGSVEVVALRAIAYRTAEVADAHRLSTLGAEAVAAAEHLGAPLCVWNGDDGPRIRAAAAALGVRHRPLSR